MKKQIFILVLFVMACFATTTKSYGQNLTGDIASCYAPVPLDPSCMKADALHPMPGQPYDYTVEVPNLTVGTGEFRWYVTQDQSFIATGNLNNATKDGVPGTWVAATGDGYDDPANASATMNITWKSFVHDPTKPVFVVIQVTGTDAADCAINNLKVYVIEPVNAFTLDIAAITDAAAGEDVTFAKTAQSCFPNIVTAVWDADSNKVDYDFGVSYTYFLVTAANYSESWRPRFQVAGVSETQSVAVDWAYSNAPTTWKAMTPPSPVTANGIYTTTDVVNVVDASGAVGTDGECILVRVTVTHNHFEGKADEAFTLAVDGETQLALTTPFKDLHHEDCADDEFENDVVTHTLLARPEIRSATPGVAPNPNPGQFLPIGAE